MKELLFSQAIHHQDERIDVHIFFVQDQHLDQTWDGRSPFDMSIDILVETASSYIRISTQKDPQFKRLELASQSLKSGDRFYFFTITFDIPGSHPEVDSPDMITVVMTVNYQIIKPDIYHFRNHDEYERFDILQRLINQCGYLEASVEKQIQSLSRKQLWELHSMLWTFTSRVDLMNWLESLTTQGDRTDRLEVIEIPTPLATHEGLRQLNQIVGDHSLSAPSVDFYQLPDLKPRIPMLAMRSTMANAVGYDSDRSLLQVEFKNGAVYQYEAVDESTWHELQASDSPGVFYNRRIKGQYRSRRVA